MRKLVRVTTPTARHFAQSQSVVEKLFDGTELIDIIIGFISGRFSFWETSAGKGLIITEFLYHKSGKELFIFSVSGKDVLKEVKLIALDLTEIAATSGCKFIGAEASSPAWEKLGKELGFLPQSVRYLKEL